MTTRRFSLLLLVAVALSSTGCDRYLPRAADVPLRAERCTHGCWPTVPTDLAEPSE